MTSLLQLCLNEGIVIQVIATQGKWCEIDSESDLRAYESILEKDENWSHDWRK